MLTAVMILFLPPREKNERVLLLTPTDQKRNPMQGILHIFTFVDLSFWQARVLRS
jgi:hypothetical protein